MVKYFFFEVKVETNESSQLRKVFYPLPGQTTYVNRSHPNEPVHTDWRLQLTLTPNGLACRCMVNSIIGIKLESNDPSDLKLSIRTRNERKFYQSDAPIYFVAPGASNVPGLDNGDEDMMNAYRALTQAGGVDPVQPNSANTSDGAAQYVPNDDVSLTGTSLAEHSENMAALGAIAEVVPQRTNELRVIEDFLVRGESEIHANRLTLQMSMLMDRMQKGVAKFSYFKQNGDFREAYGTRNQNIIESVLHGNNPNRDGVVRNRESSVPDGEHFNYFDIQQKDWRCFCVKDFDELNDDFLVMSAAQACVLSRTAVNAS